MYLYKTVFTTVLRFSTLSTQFLIHNQHVTTWIPTLTKLHKFESESDHSGLLCLWLQLSQTTLENIKQITDNMRLVTYLEIHTGNWVRLDRIRCTGSTSPSCSSKMESWWKRTRYMPVIKLFSIQLKISKRGNQVFYA